MPKVDYCELLRCFPLPDKQEGWILHMATTKLFPETSTVLLLLCEE